MLCVFSNIIGGFILLHFNCESEVPAEGTGYTSIHVILIKSIQAKFENHSAVLLHFNTKSSSVPSIKL